MSSCHRRPLIDFRWISPYRDGRCQRQKRKSSPDLSREDGEDLVVAALDFLRTSLGGDGEPHWKETTPRQEACLKEWGTRLDLLLPPGSWLRKFQRGGQEHDVFIDSRAQRYFGRPLPVKPVGKAENGCLFAETGHPAASFLFGGTGFRHRPPPERHPRRRKPADGPRTEIVNYRKDGSFGKMGKDVESEVQVEYSNCRDWNIEKRGRVPSLDKHSLDWKPYGACNVA